MRGVWLKRCQLLTPAPSANGEPSTWYADVAAPHRKPSGKRMSVICVDSGLVDMAGSEVRPLRARKPRPPPPKLLGEVGWGWAPGSPKYIQLRPTPPPSPALPP